MPEKGGRTGTRVLSIGHMGCYAAVPALATAADVVAAQAARTGDDATRVRAARRAVHAAPRTRPRPTSSRSSSSASSPTAPRASTSRPSAPDAPHFALLDHAEAILPDTLGEMTWRTASPAFRMTLTRDVPKHIRGAVAPFLPALLARNGLTVDGRRRVRRPPRRPARHREHGRGARPAPTRRSRTARRSCASAATCRPRRCRTSGRAMLADESLPGRRARRLGRLRAGPDRRRQRAAEGERGRGRRGSIFPPPPPIPPCLMSVEPHRQQRLLRRPRRPLVRRRRPRDRGPARRGASQDRLRAAALLAPAAASRPARSSWTSPAAAGLVSLPLAAAASASTASTSPRARSTSAAAARPDGAGRHVHRRRRRRPARCPTPRPTPCCCSTCSSTSRASRPRSPRRRACSARAASSCSTRSTGRPSRPSSPSTGCGWSRATRRPHLHVARYFVPPESLRASARYVGLRVDEVDRDAARARGAVLALGRAPPRRPRLPLHAHALARARLHRHGDARRLTRAGVRRPGRVRPGISPRRNASHRSTIARLADVERRALVQRLGLDVEDRAGRPSTPRRRPARR